MTSKPTISPISGFEKSGWAISYAIVQWRRQLRPVLKKAEEATDPAERAALMREAAGYFDGKAAALRAGADLAVSS